MPHDHDGFIRANTVLAAPTLVPEVRLHLASEALPLWRKTEEELTLSGLPPPYWAFAWAGGQALARYIIDHPETVAGRRVLDVASGSGITALAALWAPAAVVAANDIDDFSRAAIRLNADANGLGSGMEIIGRDMLDEPALAGDGHPLWDVVLAGDVCYERPMAERIFAWLARHAAAGALVLMGDPGRSYLPRQGVREVARYQVPTSLDLEDRDVRDTAVLQVLPPSPDAIVARGGRAP